MAEFLASYYPWTKSLHIIVVLTWMAGLFYLPRIFVYHVERAAVGSETDEVFKVMEMKLYRYIMNPSIILVWVFGLALVFTPGIVDWGSVWPYAKGAAVIGMTWFHMWLGLRRKEFLAGTNTRTGRSYRMMNEVPTLLMLVIVFAVVLKF
ncbi:CopD family protein [Rhodovulum tesquicola]|uniref:Protoporphyrinogen IX oxidase n=1 Tax=Rhodovulum steppense TaxID=540251 RepID=A0A4R1YPA1_9RHOB|nr:MULTISPECIES: CopD family protein [Rhodovulum]MCO8143747.1 CopD family protein [Rhodovulum tesquicola]TCM79979.1 putative membrane protein [Rhodovulum steppense]